MISEPLYSFLFDFLFSTLLFYKILVNYCQFAVSFKILNIIWILIKLLKKKIKQ